MTQTSVNVTAGNDAKASEYNKVVADLAELYSTTISSYAPSGGGTATLDLGTGVKRLHRVTMPAGNITVAISNAQVGQPFFLDIIQDSSGNRTVTWFTTIKWQGGGAPTLSTGANKIDSFGFIVTSAGNYQGYIVGQDL